MKPRKGRAAVLVALLLCACGGPPVRSPSGARARAEPVATSPGAVDTMIRGVQAWHDGQRDRGVALLREAIGIDGHLWEARYDLGIVLAETGDLTGAEGQLAIAAQSSRDNENVAIGLAEVRRRRGEFDLAARGLADFVHEHPGAVGARTLYVAALRESGQLDQAIVEAREVLVRQPGDSTALAELSLLRLARGEKEAAALLAKQALDASPSSAVAHRATGLIDLANGDDAMAFGEFRKAAQADPHDTTSRLNMGVVLLHAGAYAKAEEQYRQILSVDPDHTEAQVGLAAALRGEAGPQHTQKLEEARGLLEGVLAKNPHQTSALFNLGILYADFLKDSTGAAPLFERFLADTPSDDPRRAQAEKYVSAARADAQAAARSGQTGQTRQTAQTREGAEPRPADPTSKAPTGETKNKN